MNHKPTRSFEVAKDISFMFPNGLYSTKGGIVGDRYRDVFACDDVFALIDRE